MEWLTIIITLIKELGPIILPLLESLLNKEAAAVKAGFDGPALATVKALRAGATRAEAWDVFITHYGRARAAMPSVRAARKLAPKRRKAA